MPTSSTALSDEKKIQEKISEEWDLPFKGNDAKMIKDNTHSPILGSLMTVTSGYQWRGSGDALWKVKNPWQCLVLISLFI